MNISMFFVVFLCTWACFFVYFVVVCVFQVDAATRKKIEDICLDGCPVHDLGLYFVHPGVETIPLKVSTIPGGCPTCPLSFLHVSSHSSCACAEVSELLLFFDCLLLSTKRVIPCR